MPTIVVPFRGEGGKRRLAPLPDAARSAVARAMLDDVVAAAAPLGRTLLVAPGGLHGVGVETVPDPGAGQGAAVEAALRRAGDGPVLVVNADLPCATTADLEALLGSVPPSGLALVEAADGTTNALALASAGLFRPCYGSGSAARFRSLVPPALGRTVALPNLADDVDTLADLRRLGARLGPATRRALAALEAPAGAAA